MSDFERDAIEMMERCHRKLGERAQELVQLASSPERDDEAVSELLDFFAKVTRRHFADEEHSIFPRLPDDRAELAAALTKEHREHEALLNALQAAASGDGDLHALAERWSEELTSHAAREDEALLPLLRNMRDGALTAITAEMKARRGRGGGGGG
ncbi:MAG: hemerythrin domain-containing protein, partial [Polyangiaceae bacterium]